jgi:hypothetical protein
MNTTWKKIFRVLNFVEIILLVSLFSLMIFKGNLSIDKNTDDLIGVIIFLLTIIVISANCINNTKMLKLWINGQRFNLWNKIFFWIGIIFLLGLSGLVIWGNVEMYHSFHRENFRGGLQIGEIIALAWIDTIVLLSLFIAALQSILFSKAKNTFKLNQDLLIEAIGKEV